MSVENWDYFHFFRVEMISCTQNMASTSAGKSEKIWGRHLVWFYRERITNNDDFGFKRPITKLFWLVLLTKPGITNKPSITPISK